MAVAVSNLLRNAPILRNNSEVSNSNKCDLCSHYESKLQETLLELKSAWEIVNILSNEKINNMDHAVARPRNERWTTVTRSRNTSSLKDLNRPIPLTNRFSALEKEEKVSESGKQKEMCQKRKETTKKKHKVFIIGDSHTRGLAPEVKSHMSTDTDVCGIIKPGARLNVITNTEPKEIKDMSQHDAVVVWGGSNDISCNNSSEGLKNLKVLAESRINTNIVIVSAPKRHDLQDSSCVNKEVIVFNRKLKKVMKPYNHVKIIDVDVDRQHFTRHGLHLNGRGKEEMGKKIGEVLRDVIRQNRNITDKIVLPWVHEQSGNEVCTLVEPEMEVRNPADEDTYALCPRISSRAKRPVKKIYDDHL